MKNSMVLRFALAVTLSALLPFPAHSFSDQTTTERILKENKRFVEFINVCVTNFGQERAEDFRKAYEKHFNADVAYLQSDYRRAYKRVYSSQGDMEKLYRDMVKDRYLEDSKTILDRLAPGIIRSKNARARLYLTLGYRDRTVSWVHYTVGEASNEKLFSYKLYKYEDAIKMARRAKRFAFLALFESQDLQTKRKIYNQLFKSERDMGNRFMSRFIDLDEKNYIAEMEKSYGDYQKDEAAKKTGGEAVTEATQEKSVERRVRFRNESKAARYLLNGEFERAEDILRSYIDDFNFKLILATFDVLSTTDADKSAQDKTGAIDYNSFKVHLMDNYARFSNKSLLETFLGSVKVEDDIEAGKEQSKEEGTKEQGKETDSGTKKP